MIKYNKQRDIWICTSCKEEFSNKRELATHFNLKHIKARRTWSRKPQTQIKTSDKIYNRKKAKNNHKQLQKEEDYD